MLAMTVDMIKPGDYVKFRGHRIQEFLKTCWWKAVSVEDGQVHLVDRHGATARVRTNWRYQHCRALKWEPGDPRTDETE